MKFHELLVNHTYYDGYAYCCFSVVIVHYTVRVSPEQAVVRRHDDVTIAHHRDVIDQSQALGRHKTLKVT